LARLQKNKHHKAHYFDVNNGIRVDTARDPLAVTAPADPLALTGGLATGGAGAYFDETVGGATSSNFGATATSGAPAWVALDRKVLRFYAYFKEAVFSSPVENFRVRKCVIYYYLEDDSLHIAEPKIENSGIPQGVFVKRHRVPKASGEYVGVPDLGLGADLTIYGRNFHMYDCDAFTRAFYESNGRPLGEPEEAPLDPFTKKNTVKTTCHNKLMHPHKEFMEASLGKSMYGTDIEGTQKFLRNDGKVLRFYATWSDPNLFGEKQAFIVHFFLADDTVEVLEVQQPNSGRDPFPALLKRCKLPQNYKDHTADMSSIGWQRDKEVRYYTEADFRVGDYITVYGRKIFLCGADRFTQEFYIENFGMTAADFPRLNMDDEAETVPRLLPPPHTGFGSEEDSLGSFLYLMPKIPKQDFKKLMENDGLSLRFAARFLNAQPEDRDRRFVITYFLNNDTISIFEKFDRNSGFVGGKFLERTRCKNQATGEYFRPVDLYAGASVAINSFVFQLVDADDSTIQFMERNPQVFGPVLQKQDAFLSSRQ
jgi:hypothetical protein